MYLWEPASPEFARQDSRLETQRGFHAIVLSQIHRVRFLWYGLVMEFLLWETSVFVLKAFN